MWIFDAKLSVFFYISISFRLTKESYISRVLNLFICVPIRLHL